MLDRKSGHKDTLVLCAQEKGDRPLKETNPTGALASNVWHLEP